MFIDLNEMNDSQKNERNGGKTVALSWVWAGLVLVSAVFGILNGTASQVGAAAMEGAGAAVELCIGLAGALCLWSGVMALMEKVGAMEGLARLLRPVLHWLFPASRRDKEAEQALAANFSANLLGLGNAATPAGIRAAERLSDGSERAGNELCRLVVLNTASVQLLPTTICAIRAAAGSAAPFDILPAVWLTSLCSVTAGLLTARVLENRWA